MKEKMPALRQEVSTALGNAKVVSCNPIKETVTVELETGSTVELPLGQISWQAKPEGDSQQTKTQVH
jgi:cell fate regulator YaaT (PSP1 superfamily)